MNEGYNQEEDRVHPAGNKHLQIGDEDGQGMDRNNWLLKRERNVLWMRKVKVQPSFQAKLMVHTHIMPATIQTI
jgi:hypothetical protein